MNSATIRASFERTFWNGPLCFKNGDGDNNNDYAHAGELEMLDDFDLSNKEAENVDGFLNVDELPDEIYYPPLIMKHM